MSAPAGSSTGRQHTTRRGKATFVKVADALTFDPTISDGALRTYTVLASYARTVGSTTFELSATQLGTLLGRSEDQATRRTRELERAGLITVRRRRGYALRNEYTVLDPQGVVFDDRVFAASSTRMDAGSGSRTFAGSKYIGEERRGEGDELPQPVDNGAAARAPRPLECPSHRGQPAHNCAGCRADAIAGEEL